MFPVPTPSWARPEGLLKPAARQNSTPESPQRIFFPFPTTSASLPLLTHKALLLAVPQRCRPDAVGHKGKEGLLDLRSRENGEG